VFMGTSLEINGLETRTLRFVVPRDSQDCTRPFRGCIRLSRSETRAGCSPFGPLPLVIRAGTVRDMKRVLFLVAVLALTFAGCGRRSTSGLTSVNDYAYAVGNATQSQEVARRFELALDCLRKNGLHSKPAPDAEQRGDKRQVRFEGKGIDAELSLVLPEQGFAMINLTYRYEVQDPKLKTEADRLLAKLGDLLAPGRSLPASEVGPASARPKVVPSAAKI
jgi:hypothetical protein